MTTATHLRRRLAGAMTAGALLLAGCGGGGVITIQAEVIPDPEVAAPLPLARLSRSSEGRQASGGPSSTRTARASSEDGLRVVFTSEATDLVEGDTNGAADVFLHDRERGTTIRVSLGAGGGQGAGPSRAAAIDHGATRVAFESLAPDLVPGDTNGLSDVFVRDLERETTVRISVATDGSEADGPSSQPALSPDGRFVVFESEASNLVPGDTNGVRDLFVHDLEDGTTTRVSLADDGAEADGPSFNGFLCGEGRVAFDSEATNLVPGDTNGVSDVFLRDTIQATTLRISVDSQGAQASGPSARPAGDEAGARIAFESEASDLVADDTNGVADVFLRDLTTGATSRLSVTEDGQEGDGPSGAPSLSGEGHFAVFESDASNLAPDDQNGARDLFCKEVEDGELLRLTVNRDGVQADGPSSAATLSPGELNVVFTSEATNLDEGDTNGVADVFGGPNFFVIPDPGGGGHGHHH